MSLNKSPGLIAVAKTTARELRKKQTRSEQLFWEAVRGRRLMGKKFLRQHPVFHDRLGKETFYIADFYCAEERLIVEIDGKVHEFQEREDRQRDSILADLGYRVFHIRAGEIEADIGQVKEEMLKMLTVR